MKGKGKGELLAGCCLRAAASLPRFWWIALLTSSFSLSQRSWTSLLSSRNSKQKRQTDRLPEEFAHFHFSPCIYFIENYDATTTESHAVLWVALLLIRSFPSILSLPLSILATRHFRLFNAHNWIESPRPTNRQTHIKANMQRNTQSRRGTLPVFITNSHILPFLHWVWAKLKKSLNFSVSFRFFSLLECDSGRWKTRKMGQNKWWKIGRIEQLLEGRDGEI